MKNFFLTLLALVLCLTAGADVPFRNHRYESFKALRTDTASIVFAGNSITNMHEWWEAFSCEPRIVNRGNSGGYTQEIIDNLESYLTGRPAKLFLMIGTNDLGTSGLNTVPYVAGNIRAIAKRIVKESPRTKLYIQSILPSNNGIRNNTLTQQVNDSLAGICKEFPNTEYVDLWNTLYPMGNLTGTLGKTTNSYDNLHPNAWGYAQWCHKIDNIVGYRCSYPAPSKVQLFNGGLNNSWGSRITQFTSLPVDTSDVLILGEEMIHGGEWHELLHSAKVKGRGTGWGFGDNLDAVKRTIEPMFTGYEGVAKADPKQIFLSLGIGQVAGSASLTVVRDNVAAVVDLVKQYAPTSELFLMGCHPLGNAATNTNRVVPFNDLMQTLAVDKGATYIDIYTPLQDRPLNNYVDAIGYAKISQALAPYIYGATATTCEEVEENLTLYNARNALGSKISALDLFTHSAVGDEVGQFPATALDGLDKVLEEAYSLLAEEPSSVSVDRLSAMSQRLDEAKARLAVSINKPTPSTDGHYIWYGLQSEREGRYIKGRGAGAALTGVTSQDTIAAAWRLVEREDGSFDLINRKDATFISPASAHNNALKAVATQPAAGWTITYSTQGDYFVLTSSTTAEINQTGSAQNYAIYNWFGTGAFPNLTDQGCHYRFVRLSETTDTIIAQPEPLKPILTLTDITSDGQTPYRLSDEDAQRIFHIGEGSMTVAIDFTVNATQTGSGAFAAQGLITTVGDTPSGSSYDEFFSMVLRNAGSGYGVEYLGRDNLQIGWYTASNVSFNNKRGTIVITMNKDGEYRYFHDGVFSRSVGPMSAFGQYGFRTFANIPTAHAVYLLGATNSSGTNRFLTRGTIHSLRVYDKALTDDEVLGLNFDLNDGIRDLPRADDEHHTVAYDLLGRRVGEKKKGLVVIGGRKVVR